MGTADETLHAGAAGLPPALARAGHRLCAALRAAVPVLVLVLGVLGAGWAGAETRARPAAVEGVAVGGFDPVAYFTDGRAVPGRPDIALRWRGVRWHFASAAHRAAFEADPRAYAPAFGGFCAAAAGEGLRVPADPQHWAIVDGRLYLARNAADLARLVADPQGVLAAARANWPMRTAGGD